MADASLEQLKDTLAAMLDDGKQKLSFGQFAQAEFIFRTLASYDVKPTGVRAVFLTHLAEALFQQGKVDEAESAFTEATMVDPQSAFSWYALASFLAKLERRPESKAACLKSLELLQGTTDPDLFPILEATQRLMKWHLGAATG
jgi:tetratricopeptide (TPR) repeat protein